MGALVQDFVGAVGALPKDDISSEKGLDARWAAPTGSPTTVLAYLHGPPPRDAGASSARAASGGAAACSGKRCKHAYVTLITRDSYLMGVQGLLRSLIAVGVRHPLVVMYTADTLSGGAVEALAREGCVMRPVDRYKPPAGVDHRQYKLRAYAECWTKLRMWEWEEYERLVYLDADIIVRANIDALFSLPPGFYAAPDCAYGRKTQAERDACALLTKAGRPSYFNAGMFVMAPDAALLQRWGALLAEGAVEVGGFAEQDFLNAVLKDRWQPLPPAFNLQKGIKLHHPELWAPHEAFIIHYTDRKPWDEPHHAENEAYSDIVQLWWHVFEGYAPGAALRSVKPDVQGQGTLAHHDARISHACRLSV